jgi:hypothetical protein
VASFSSERSCRQAPTLADNEWGRLAHTISELKPINVDDATEVLEEATGLFLRVNRWSEEIKATTRAFLDLNKRI